MAGQNSNYQYASNSEGIYCTHIAANVVFYVRFSDQWPFSSQPAAQAARNADLTCLLPGVAPGKLNFTDRNSKLNQ